MVKQSIFDDAYDELNRRMNGALSLMSKDFKGVKPFGKEFVPMEEQLTQYERIKNDPVAINQLVAQRGQDAVEKWLGNMVKARIRRQ